MEDNQTYSGTYNESSLIEKILIELNQNNNLYSEVKKVLYDLLGKMIKSGFVMDESILPKIRELAVIEKPRYEKREKSYEVENNKISVCIDTIYDESGPVIAMEMILNHLFPNNDPKTEALYQNMIKGLVNTFVGGKSMDDGFRVNELMSLTVGCDYSMGLQSHPLFLAFCQGNMSLCIDKLKQKLINNGISAEIAEQKISDLLKILNYQNNREIPNFLRTAQKQLTEIFLLTQPSEAQILDFTSKVILSPVYYDIQEERAKHGYLEGFEVEYKQMIDNYLNSRVKGYTK